jgi:glycosyltransferase involved in cell wall biosynthesis
MRILHVVAGLPAAGGGLAEAVARLAREAIRIGHEVTIATVAGQDEPLASAAGEAEAAGVRIARHEPSAPRSIYFSRDMFHGLAPLSARADVVHVHSNWTFPVWWGCRAAIAAGKPLVISPHGCLDPVRLAHSAWKKRLVGALDRRCLRQADVIHATSEAERGWIERYVGGRPHIDVIPIGVDLPSPRESAKPADRTRTVLFLGRLHPLKGLDLLLEAWPLAMRELGPGDRWHLVIAGPDEQGTRARLERQAQELGLGNVRFAGPLDEAEKARALADADLAVLPSRSENFGIVVAEALAAGVPVITTKGTPWQEIDRSCGWWVDVAAPAIAAALAAAMRLSDAERAAMGARGRGLIEAKYQWPSVGRAMIDTYERLTG